MKEIVPITDLQRQAGQIVSGLAESDEPVFITQRGRAAAVIISVARYAQIEEDLQRLDELELLNLAQEARQAMAQGQTISHRQVKARLQKRARRQTNARPRAKKTRS
jgi:prevent-host-death family protein